MSRKSFDKETNLSKTQRRRSIGSDFMRLLISPLPESTTNIEGLGSVKSEQEQEVDFEENYPFHMTQEQVNILFF